MRTYDLSQRGDATRYEYLYRCIREDIRSGELAPDEHLPAKRRLAERLGVSVITVEAAYRQLIAEGYVYSRAKRGYYVSDLPLAPAPRGRRPASSVTSARRVPEPRATPPLLADFSQSAQQTSASAAALWGKALRSTMGQEPRSELFAVPPAAGADRLRSAIAQYLGRARGMQVLPEQVIVAAGAPVLYALIALMLPQTAVIAVEDPGYPRLWEIYQRLGKTPLALPLDSEGIDSRRLQSSVATIAHVMPSHQFPTGTVMSIARRYELLGWAAAAQQRYLIEDDYDWEFRFAGMPIPALQSIDTLGKVIYLSTFSKSLSAALRIAFAVVPLSLCEQVQHYLGAFTGTVNAIDQIALARLLEAGEYERHLNRYRKQARELRDRLLVELKRSPLGPQMQILEADSGLHFVMRLDTAKSETEIAAQALKRGVKLAPLALYQQQSPAQPRTKAEFVMQYDGMPTRQVRAVVAALVAAVAAA